MSDETPAKHEHLDNAAAQIMEIALTHHTDADNFAARLAANPNDAALRRAHMAAKVRGDALLAESKKLSALARLMEPAST